MNRRDNPNSSVKSREKVYCMNEEYRFIYEFLDSHPDLKERFIFVYSMQRFRNYFWTYSRIDRKFKGEYLERMSAELNEAARNKELDRKYFTPFEWKKICWIMKDPSAARKWMALSMAARKIKKIGKIYDVENRSLSFYKRGSDRKDYYAESINCNTNI